MRSLLLNIGKKSKKAFSVQLNSKKKDKVLKDYFLLINRHKDSILRENQKDIKMMTYRPTEMHSDLDQIMQKINKTTGKGSIRITGLQESDDGTTINLFITKE